MGSDPSSLKPDSDDWWVHRLSKKLMEDRERVQHLFEVYDGKPLIDLGSTEANEGFSKFLKMANLNLSALIVNTMTPRMQPVAFKTSSDQDQDGDEEAFKIMRRCDLDVVFADILLWTSITGRGYGMVTKFEKKAWITAEHPSQVISEKHPITGHDIAAVKLYHDDVRQKDIAVLHRKGYYREYSIDAPLTKIPDKHTASFEVDPGSWAKGERINTGISGCAVVSLGRGVGEFEPFLETLRRIVHTILQRLVIVTLQAFKQRAIKGVPTHDPKTGEKIDYRQIFTTDPGAMWILPAVAEIWESGVVDLTPILSSIKDDVKDLAVESSTPLYTISSDAAQGSAEGAALQRETQVFKVEDRIRRYTGALSRMMAYAFEMDGDTERASLEGLETVWKDPNRSSLTERAASATQAAQAGAPWSYVMTHFIRMTPKELAEARRERTKEQLMAMGMQGGTAPSATPGVQSGRPSTDSGNTGSDQSALEDASGA